MKQSRTLRMRTRRACAAALVVGLALTAALFVVVRADVDRLARKRIDEPAAAAVLAVQHLTASVDQVLATANGVVATSGSDPERFRTVLGPDIDASTTLTGIALLVPSERGARVLAVAGTVPHLAKNVRGAVAATGATSRLVGYRRDAHGFQLAFAQSVAHGSSIVYLEIRLAAASAGIPFALVTKPAHAKPTVVMGTVGTTRNLTKWSQNVSLGGRTFALFVEPGPAPSGGLGLPLPQLVIVIGIALTVLAMATARQLVRRAYATERLSDENQALDEALERQRVIETELLAWQTRFQTILRDTPDVIAILDATSGSCEILNRPGFLGHGLETLVAGGGLASLVDEDDDAEADAYWVRLDQLDAERVCETTLRLHDADDRIRFVRLRFSPLNTPAERMLLGLLSDVTDQWTNQLREEELQEALRRAQRLESVGHLAGGIAHDFNNVLAAVMGSIELLMDDVPAGRPMEYANEIQHAASRGAALVRQLLTYAQCDGAEPQIVDVNDVVTGMSQLLRRTIGANVQLQVSTSEHACRITADPTHIEQIILNLAINARDAMPDGGILWIATAIDFDDEAPENDRVVLSVTDTGTGIAPEVRERMFQPFVSTKDPGKGTGLGLATVLSIVQASDGRINVVSQVDQGTTFEISFARCFGLPTATASSAESDDFLGAGRRVLLVEDDVAVRAAVAHLLQRMDFTVATAPDGLDALRLVEQQTFDLVLTDAIMPGMSGLELVQHLRQSHPDLHVILMSGYSPEIAGSDDLPSGVRRLRKPFTTPDLNRALWNEFESESMKETFT